MNPTSIAGWALVAALFASCDWNAAERTARCNAGERSQCADAAVSVDADGGDDAGDGFEPPAPWTGPGPVRLHPRAAGGYWVVANVAGGGLVEAYDSDGGLVSRQAMGGHIIGSYADDRIAPEAAVLVEGAGAGVTLWLVAPDGGVLSTGPLGARWVTTYSSSGVPRVSVWANDGGTYDQRLFNTALGDQGRGGPAACDFEFHDLQVLPREASPVIIAYTSRSCPTTTTTFMEANTMGLHRINQIGERLFIPTTDKPQRVGEWDEGTSYGFETASVRAHGTELVQRRYTAATNGLSYAAGPAVILSCADGLRLGDVSGGLISGVTNGALSGHFQNSWGTGSGPQAFVGRNEAGGWVRYLGPTVAGSDVRVLRHGETVITAWLELDGGTSVSRLHVSDGR